MLKVFLSGSIRGGRRLLDTYQFMVEVITTSGGHVVSPHVARRTILEEEEDMSEEEIFFRDIEGIRRCDCLVAEVTVPSTGVGYEICHALGLGRSVLCVYECGADVSSMVLGNSGVTTRCYRDSETLKTIIVDFMKTC